MSVRELNEALKARDEAEEKAAAAEDEARRLRWAEVLASLKASWSRCALSLCLSRASCAALAAARLQGQLTGQAQVYEAKLTSAGVEADQARAAAKAAQEALDKQRDKAPVLPEHPHEVLCLGGGVIHLVLQILAPAPVGQLGLGLRQPPPDLDGGVEHHPAPPIRGRFTGNSWTLGLTGWKRAVDATNRAIPNCPRRKEQQHERNGSN